METCIFCKIVKGELPSYKVYEDEKVLGFLDISPVNLGHILLVSKKHFENIFDMDDETAGHLIKTAKKLGEALKKTGADGVNITLNNGRAAGQIIFHSHVHIIPRFVQDNLLMWPNKKYKEGEAKKIAEKIISRL